MSRWQDEAKRGIFEEKQTYYSLIQKYSAGYNNISNNNVITGVIITNIMK